MSKNEKVNHPKHYGGEGNVYEAIKVIEAHELGFNLGNTVKYVLRVDKKEGEDPIECLEKALWYLQREIQNRKNEARVKSTDTEWDQVHLG